jgi:hypothetical protein
LLIVFQVCSVIWIWLLLTVSGDEFCGPLPTLFQAVTYTGPLLALLLFQPLLTESVHGDQLLAPSLVCFQHPTPSAVCLFSVPCLLFSYLFIYLFL